MSGTKAESLAMVAVINCGEVELRFEYRSGGEMVCSNQLRRYFNATRVVADR